MPEDATATFIEKAPAAIAMFDLDMRYIAVSQRFLDNHNIGHEGPRAVVGRRHYDLFPDLPERWREIHVRVLAGESLAAQDDPFVQANGAVDWFNWEMNPWRRDTGEIAGAILYAENVTARVKAQIALAESEQLSRIMQEVGHIGAWDWDLITDRVSWSDFQCRQFGLDPGTDGGPSFAIWSRCIHPDDLPAIEAHLAALIRSGETADIEYRIHGPDGPRWLYARAHVFRNAEGRAVRMVGIDMDITARHEAADLRKALTRELQHRVTNTLGMVQVIARQTFGGLEGVAEPMALFRGRLRALARAHEMLTAERPMAASLRQVITEQLSAPTGDGRVEVCGADVDLGPQRAVAIGLIIHELGANANKYGALSNATGRVAITWRVDPAARELSLSWIETGGPPVTPPTRRGFGSLLIERGLAADLGARAVLRFDPGGLRCEVALPLDSLTG